MLIEFEAMLHASVQRVGRTVRNLRQESSDGYGSKTPGSGEPGGGKGSGPTVAVRVERGAPWRRSQVDPARLTVEERAEWEALQRSADRSMDRVPVSSAELRALGLGGDDPAAATMAGLDFSSYAAAYHLWRAALWCAVAGDAEEPGPPPQTLPLRNTVLAYAMAVRASAAVASVSVTSRSWEKMVEEVEQAERHVERLFHICQTWGYDPKKPAPPKVRADLLAVDLTERWCTSHLRVGAKADRSRGELCDWCYRHGPLLVATWSAPPRKIVEIKVERGKVYAHELEPYIRAERSKVKAGR
jgi:hypothetical protein